MESATLLPRYEQSSALIIGIDAYVSSSPLSHARSDAEAVARALVADLGFPKDRVTALLDEAATREAILDAFLALADGLTSENDRVVFFFAGHGHTQKGHRGDVGFLVPYEGDVNKTASLLRWDELTRGAELIPAKHVLFLMDACYGGVAVTRRPPGSMRFLRNMLLRRARQVLTAGKADEVVADSGGPMPGHSVFTGHLLEGLEGKAFDADGNLTANALMAYVYEHVSRDPDSHQTPHYGHVDGDGDLVFASSLVNLYDDGDPAKDEDVLVAVPVVKQNHSDADGASAADRAKHLLADPVHRVMLHDHVAQLVREAASLTAQDSFPVRGEWGTEEFLERLNNYEEVLGDLCEVETLLGYWAQPAHCSILTLAPKRLSDPLTGGDGNPAWLALRWYPVFLLMYAGGVAAVAGERYGNLHALLHATTRDQHRAESTVPVMYAATGNLNTPSRDLFKQIPGRERNHTPRSEHLHKVLQPIMDDHLFLGAEYDFAFDKFEVLFALEYALERRKQAGHLWGPIGRFGYKYHSGGSSPFHRIVEEAQELGEDWEPLKAGLFEGSPETFAELAREFSMMLQKLAWF